MIHKNLILKCFEGALSTIGTVNVVILNDDLIKTTILSDISFDISATATEKAERSNKSPENLNRSLAISTVF